MNSVNRTSGQKYKKPGFWLSAGGITAGIASLALQGGLLQIIDPKIEKISNDADKVTPDEFKKINKAADKILEENRVV